MNDEKANFDFPLRMLDSVGLDPYKNDLFSRIKLLFTTIVLFITLISAFMEIIIHYQGFDTIVRAAQLLLPIYQCFWKFGVLFFYRSRLRKLIAITKNFWPLDAFGKELCIDGMKIQYFLKRAAPLYRFSMMLTVVNWVFTCLRSEGFHSFCIFYGENEDISFLARLAMNLFQIIYFIVLLNLVLGLDIMFYYIIGYAMTEFEMLKISYGSEKISRNWDDVKRFKFSVIHHSCVLEFVKYLDGTVRNLLLHQHLSSVFGICFGLFLVSLDGIPPDMKHLMKYSGFIIAFTTQIFIYCLAGTLLIENVIFYEAVEKPCSNRLGYLIALQRSQRAANLSLGGFAPLDLDSFNLVVKNSLSFFTFMNAIFADEN